MESFPSLRPYVKTRLTGPHVQLLNIRDLNDWAAQKWNEKTLQSARFVIVVYNTKEAIARGYHFNPVLAMQSFDEEHKKALFDWMSIIYLETQTTNTTKQ